MDAGGVTNRPTSATAATPTMSAATVAVRLDGRRMLSPRSGPRPTPWMAVWPGAALLRLFCDTSRAVNSTPAHRITVLPAHRQCSRRDSGQPAAQAHQRPGGAEHLPDAIQQPPPAAQRPRVGQMPDGLLHQRPQPCLLPVVGPLRLAELVFGAAITDRHMPVLAIGRRRPSGFIGTRTATHAAFLGSWSIGDEVQLSRVSWNDGE